MHTTSSTQTKRSGRAIVLTIVVALAAFVLPALVLAQTPTPIDLGHLGGGSASATAGATGYVGGTSTTGATFRFVPPWAPEYASDMEVRHAFIWSAATQSKVDIGALIPSAAISSVTGVNSRGEAVGGYMPADLSATYGFYWSATTGVVLLGQMAPNYSEHPLLINESGVVAGVNSAGEIFRWQNGSFQNLGTTGYGDTKVSGINARGDIVGNSGGGAAAFVAWASSSPLTILTSPGDWTPRGVHHGGEVNIQVNGINDSGVVVGTYWDFKYIPDWGMDWVHKSHAFKWSSGTFTDLGTLGGGRSPNSANAINNSGVIVGYSTVSNSPFIYDAFSYAGSGPMTALQRMPGASYSQATSINNDGIIAGFSDNVGATATVWENGVPRYINFGGIAPGGSYSDVRVSGRMLWGNVAGKAWAMGLAAPPPPLPTQTLTILGGSGNVGDIAANVEYFNPATNQWQPAYLTQFYNHLGQPVAGHPWGNVSGTNQWINYEVDGRSDPGAGPTTNQTRWYLYRVRFTVPADALEPKMTFSLKADNFAQVAINGVTAGGSTQFINNANMNNVVVGQADQVNVDAAFSQNVQVGENTITLNIGDWGGLNGFNFRIDLSMKSSQPLEIIEPPSDTTPPLITSPGNLTREAAGPAGTVVSFTASAVDAVDGPVAVVADPVSGSTFPIGATTVDLDAADSAGNLAHATFTVTVQDTIAPALTVPASVSAEATSASGATVTYAAATATDAVGVTSITYGKASGSTFALGSTTVGVTASDAAGNSSSGSFSVTVKDTTAPALAGLTNQVLEATSAAGATATIAVTATDAVGVTSLTTSHASGTFPIGTTTVSATASDGAGNSSSGSFTVTVRDTTKPVIGSVTPSSATLWPPNHQMVAITLNTVASDAVGVTGYQVTATSSEPDNGLGDGDTANDIQITGSGSLNPVLNLRAERSGGGNGRTYTISVVAIDAAGNTSAAKTCTVSVPKSQGKK